MYPGDEELEHTLHEARVKMRDIQCDLETVSREMAIWKDEVQVMCRRDQTLEIECAQLRNSNAAILQRNDDIAMIQTQVRERIEREVECVHLRAAAGTLEMECVQLRKANTQKDDDTGMIHRQVRERSEREIAREDEVLTALENDVAMLECKLAAADSAGVTLALAELEARNVCTREALVQEAITHANNSTQNQGKFPPKVGFLVFLVSKRADF